MEKLTKEKARELMALKGEARGVHFKNDAEFVLKEKGGKGLEAVEKEFERLGYPMKYKEINQFDFYPLGLRALSLLIIKETFSWPDEKIRELCEDAMKFSWIIRLLMKYFFSIEKVSEEVPRTWSKYFSSGKALIKEYDLKKKYAILIIKDFNLHPIYCCCLEGVASGVLKMVVNSKKITCREVECAFKRGKEHKFLIKWS